MPRVTWLLLLGFQLFWSHREVSVACGVLTTCSTTSQGAAVSAACAFCTTSERHPNGMPKTLRALGWRETIVWRLLQWRPAVEAAAPAAAS